jgi:hypothetical protein
LKGSYSQPNSNEKNEILKILNKSLIQDISIDERLIILKFHKYISENCSLKVFYLLEHRSVVLDFFNIKIINVYSLENFFYRG